MNVSLTPELERIVETKVKSGMYTSASEVVREGLRLLEQRDKLDAAALDRVRVEVQKGLDDLESGRASDGAAIMKRFRSRLLALKEPNA